MSPVPVELPERASQRLARVLFLTIWAVSLLPVLLLTGIGYGLFGVLLRQAPVETQRLMLAATGGIAALTGLAAWYLGRRFAAPVEALAASLAHFAQGDQDQRAPTGRQDELGLLARLFNQMADEIKVGRHSASLRAAESPSLSQSQALLGLAYLIETAPGLSELQRGALELIVKQYACTFAALYRIERSQPIGASYAVLAQTAGSSESLPPRLSRRFNETRINLDLTPTLDWMVSKTLVSRRTQSGPAEGDPNLVEASLPLIRRSEGGEERLIGVLDLYAASRVSDSRLGPFSGRALTELQAIASLLALTEGAQPSEAAPCPGEEARPAAASAAPLTAAGLLPMVGASQEIVFNAGRKLAQVDTFEQALQAVGEALRSSPFLHALLIQTNHPQDETAQEGYLEIFDCRGEPTSLRPQEDRSGLNDLPIAPLQSFFLARRGELLVVENVGQSLQEARREPAASQATALRPPPELLEVAQAIGCESVAFVPDVLGERLLGVLVVGRPPRPALRNLEAPPLNPVLLEPLRGLIHLADVAIERVCSQDRTQRRLAELETVWQVSQTIAEGNYSGEQGLGAIYPLLHQQVEKVMGQFSSFAVLLYEAETNQVHVPYMFLDGKLVQVAAFALSNSLSGQVIRTQQPMLLKNRQEVEDMTAKIGSVLVGQSPLSWLGAPMMFAGEILGVIVAQDIYQEYRFGEPDMRLLSTLAIQAAVVVHNARLLETSRQQVEQAQMLNEITARIRRAVDIQSILKTTADELGLALGARRAHIRILPPQAAARAAPPEPPAVEAER